MGEVLRVPVVKAKALPLAILNPPCGVEPWRLSKVLRMLRVLDEVMCLGIRSCHGGMGSHGWAEVLPALRIQGEVRSPSGTRIAAVVGMLDVAWHLDVVRPMSVVWPLNKARHRTLVGSLGADKVLHVLEILSKVWSLRLSRTLGLFPCLGFFEALSMRRRQYPGWGLHMIMALLLARCPRIGYILAVGDTLAEVRLLSVVELPRVVDPRAVVSRCASDGAVIVRGVAAGTIDALPLRG